MSAIAVDGATEHLPFDGLTGIALWDIDSPTLYTLDLALDTQSGSDAISISFGFCHAEFTKKVSASTASR